MRLLAVLLLATSLLPVAAEAADASDLRRLFPRERDLFIERDGLTRLALPADVLTACRSDLSDLRVFDAEEREVPYLIDAGLPRKAELDVVRTHAAEVLDVRREERRREDGPPVYRETYVFAAPPASEVPWDLVFEAGGRRFVRRLEIAAEGGGAILTGASIFRLPDLPAERLRVALPSPAPERITVTLEGEDGGYLEPRLRFETTTTVASTRAEVVVPLEEASRQTQDGRTVVELLRPRGVAPDVVDLATTTSSFNRAVELWDEAPGRAPILLARARVFRVQAPEAVEEREIAVQPARGERLRLVIDDGDSPPLEGLAVAAVVGQPVLVFSLRGAGVGPVGRLRFGGGRAHAPRYDLAAFLPAGDPTLRGERALATARLYDATQAGSGRLGETRDNPLFDRTPALAFAMRAGAPVDARAWTHRRTVTVPESPDGLTRVRLTAADLAQARPDLGDVRVVDAESRQWPYLLDQRDAEAWAELGVAAPRRDRGTSSYELSLPTTPITITTLGLESDVPFFDRAAHVIGRRRDGTEVTLAAGHVSKIGNRPAPIRLALRRERIDALEIRIDDGNDAPLAFRARALISERDLYLAAPAGAYVLLVGNEDAEAPRYELERVRDVILGVGSSAAEPSDLTTNPAYSMRARLASEGRIERTVPMVALWLVLIGAVVVLTVVTLRLARRGSAGDESSKPA